MKDVFPAYYPMDGDEFRELWTVAHFVLDASALLDLYRYPHLRDSYFKALRQIGDRLWVPHQVMLEYLRNREEVIRQKMNAVAEAKKATKESKTRIEQALRKADPTLDVDSILKKTSEALAEVEEHVENALAPWQSLLTKDTIRHEIEALFLGKIGEPYPSERLIQIYRDGELRYARKIPPGYEDLGRKDNSYREYGDLVLWNQIIDHAKQSKKPIIFVTGEAKSDWWAGSKGSVTGPRPELVQEILTEAGVAFHMYQTERFVGDAGEYLGVPVEKEAVAGVAEERLHAVEAARAAVDAQNALIRVLMPEGLQETLNLYRQQQRDLTARLAASGYFDQVRAANAIWERLQQQQRDLAARLAASGALDAMLRTQAILNEAQNRALRSAILSGAAAFAEEDELEEEPEGGIPGGSITDSPGDSSVSHDGSYTEDGTGES